MHPGKLELAIAATDGMIWYVGLSLREMIFEECSSKKQCVTDTAFISKVEPKCVLAPVEDQLVA